MPRACTEPFPFHWHRNVAEVEARAYKMSSQFSEEERVVIRERRKYQSATELAAVFETRIQVIGAIIREGKRG